MRHPIDPKIDCVFKALLGSEGSRALQAMSTLEAALAEVERFKALLQRKTHDSGA